MMENITHGNIHDHLLFGQYWRIQMFIKRKTRNFGSLLLYQVYNGGYFQNKYSSQIYTIKWLKLRNQYVYLLIGHHKWSIGTAALKTTVIKYWFMCNRNFIPRILCPSDCSEFIHQCGYLKLDIVCHRILPKNLISIFYW